MVVTPLLYPTSCLFITPSCFGNGFCLCWFFFFFLLTNPTGGLENTLNVTEEKKKCKVVVNASNLVPQRCWWCTCTLPSLPLQSGGCGSETASCLKERTTLSYSCCVIHRHNVGEDTEGNFLIVFLLWNRITDIKDTGAFLLLISKHVKSIGKPNTRTPAEFGLKCATYF